MRNGYVRRGSAVLAAAAAALAGAAVVAPAAGATGSPTVLFERYRDGQFDVWAMNPDGTGQVNLSNDPGEDYDPVWSPDGTRIAFESDRDGDFDIYVMDADGTDVVNVTANTGTHDQSVSWSPDGTRLAYLRDGAGRSLMTIGVDGTGATEVTGAYDRIAAPSWSPDGTRLGFTAWTPWPSLFTIGADGSGATQVTAAGCSYIGSKWAPDGQRLVSVRNCNGTERVVLVSPHGAPVVELPLAAAGQPYLPAISGDGLTITYAFIPDASATGNAEVWSMGVDGSGAHALTDGTDWDDDPAMRSAAPGAPAVTSVSAGEESVTVTWAAPGSNGNATITGYRVTASPGGATATAGATGSATVTGLSAGTSYTFTVVATNANGDGPASAPSTPIAPLAAGQEPSSFSGGSAGLSAMTTTSRTTTTAALSPKVRRTTVVAVTARLVDGGGAGIGGETVQLWTRRAGRWVKVATARTKADGKVAFVRNDPAMAYQVRHPASAAYGASVAVPRSVRTTRAQAYRLLAR